MSRRLTCPTRGARESFKLNERMRLALNKLVAPEQVDEMMGLPFIARLIPPEDMKP